MQRPCSALSSGMNQAERDSAERWDALTDPHRRTGNRFLTTLSDSTILPVHMTAHLPRRKFTQLLWRHEECEFDSTT